MDKSRFHVSKVRLKLKVLIEIWCSLLNQSCDTACNIIINMSIRKTYSWEEVMPSFEMF